MNTNKQEKMKMAECVRMHIRETASPRSLQLSVFLPKLLRKKESRGQIVLVRVRICAWVLCAKVPSIRGPGYKTVYLNRREKQKAGNQNQ